MGSIREGGEILSVVLGEHQRWHVMSKKFSHALATFDDPRSACAWATERAKPLHDKVLVEDIPVV